MADLKGKNAVVTGASRGIGYAAAIALAKEGVNIVLAARNEHDLLSVKAEVEALGVRALAVPTDVTDEAAVASLKKAALAEFGQIDILVNNAGVARYVNVLGTTIEDYDWMMDTNMRSTFLCTIAFLPEMVERESGSIITVSSQAGLFGFGGEAVYCATKFAQVGFCQALDNEVREKNVKVSIIAPGGVGTHFAIGTGREEGAPYLDEMLDADSVADAIVFAASQPPKTRILLIGMRPMSEPPF
jgi:NADP-dependent 3-hydroxy acid dehydrogenase YdfG